EFEHKEGLRVAAVSTVDAARSVIAVAAPAVILMEETALTGEPKGNDSSPSLRLGSVVSAFVLHAPVVIIGEAHREGELAALVNAGPVDFVPCENSGVPAALRYVQERLHKAPSQPAPAQRGAPNNDANASEAFGEVLRHELNNPLTGILGNAELLLAEVRRKNDGRLPRGGQQRLETIAELAVRLRETVRRLSEDWKTRNHAAS